MQDDKAVAEAVADTVEDAHPTGPFCIAKASARPMMMQLVMIRPTKTDNCLADVVEVGLEHLIRDDDQRGDHGELHDDADVRRDLLAQELMTVKFDSVSTAITAMHMTRRTSHLRGHGEGRADAEHLQGDRVVVEQRIEKAAIACFGQAWFSLSPELGDALEDRDRSRSSPSQNSKHVGDSARGDRGAAERPSTS